MNVESPPIDAIMSFGRSGLVYITNESINGKAKIGRSYICLPCSTNIMRGGSMGKKASKLHIINRSGATLT